MECWLKSGNKEKLGSILLCVPTNPSRDISSYRCVSREMWYPKTVSILSSVNPLWMKWASFRVEGGCCWGYGTWCVGAYTEFYVSLYEWAVTLSGYFNIVHSCGFLLNLFLPLCPLALFISLPSLSLSCSPSLSLTVFFSAVLQKFRSSERCRTCWQLVHGNIVASWDPSILAGVRIRLLSSRQAAPRMAFFPLLTSPPVSRLIFPFGT